MALDNHNRSRLTIGLTFLAAFLLSVLPVPVWAEPFRPDWVGLTLIYWCMATPARIGVGVGWTVGLILDVLYGSLLGQQALAKTLLAFVTIKLHLQLRMFPRWQQAVSVFVLIGMNYLLLIWIKSLVDQPTVKWSYLTSGIVSMVIWPWLFIILRDIRRRVRVS